MSDKERDFKFCFPLDLCAETLHGLRLDFTWLDRSVAAAIEIFSEHVFELRERRNESFFFFFYFFYFLFVLVSVDMVNIDLVNIAQRPL